MIRYSVFDYIMEFKRRRLACKVVASSLKGYVLVILFEPKSAVSFHMALPPDLAYEYLRRDFLGCPF